jgi:hypothetical protein
MNPAEWPPWIVMWVLATGIFAVCKVVTWRAGYRSAHLWRHAAYFVAWPGLDARAFLGSSHAKAPRAGEWLFAVAKLGLGAGLLWIVGPRVPGELAMLRGWLGMAGIVFVLHFGIFHLLSCVWRAVGVEAKPLMNWPVAASSLADFWGRRWNTAFRDLTFHLLFRPLTRSLGAKAGLAAGFLFSGVLHDLVISVPAGGGYGWPTLYFTIQGIGLLVERGLKLRGMANRVFAAALLLVPAAALFHRPFLETVVLPFLDAIGVA